jgi:hypothetical protein
MNIIMQPDQDNIFHDNEIYPRHPLKQHLKRGSACKDFYICIVF